jgi:transcription antitermination protein NusB
MATPRETRRLAFQLLFQMDAQGPGSAPPAGSTEPHPLHSWMDHAELGAEFSTKEKDAALETARGAFDARAAADATFGALAPTWPSHRQAAADRAILRLAHYEIHACKAPPKAVVNDAIELAKEFSTDRSPAFINGLLDKVLKQRQKTEAEG